MDKVSASGKPLDLSDLDNLKAKIVAGVGQINAISTPTVLKSEFHRLMKEHTNYKIKQKLINETKLGKLLYE